MFGLGKADRELDRGLIPTPVKVFALLLAAVFFGLAFSGNLPLKRFAPLPNDVVFGCYISDSQDRIRIDQAGFSLENQAVKEVEFRLIRGKTLLSMELEATLDAEIVDNRLSLIRTDERRVLRNLFFWTNQGVFTPELNDLPINRLEIVTLQHSKPVTFNYRRESLESCDISDEKIEHEENYRPS